MFGWRLTGYVSIMDEMGNDWLHIRSLDMIEAMSESEQIREELKQNDARIDKLGEQAETAEKLNDIYKATSLRSKRVLLVRQQLSLAKRLVALESSKDS